MIEYLSDLDVIKSFRKKFSDENKIHYDQHHIPLHLRDDYIEWLEQKLLILTRHLDETEE